MKYIDADLLRKEVKRLEKAAHRSALGCADSETRKFHEGKDFAYQHVGVLIDSLQQEQPELPKIERAEYYYHKGVYEGLSQGRADALKILDEFMKRNADPVLVIKQQEQPKVDLEIEDIEKIHTFLYAVKNNKQGVFTFTRLSDEQYKEVIRRFKAIKEEK